MYVMSTKARNPLRAILLALVASATILLAGCGSSAANTATSGTSPSDTPESASPPAAQVVNLVGGGQIDLNSTEGTDTVLWFWAPW